MQKDGNTDELTIKRMSAHTYAMAVEGVTVILTFKDAEYGAPIESVLANIAIGIKEISG